MYQRGLKGQQTAKKLNVLHVVIVSGFGGRRIRNYSIGWNSKYPIFIIFILLVCRKQLLWLLSGGHQCQTLGRPWKMNCGPRISVLAALFFNFVSASSASFSVTWNHLTFPLDPEAKVLLWRRVFHSPAPKKLTQRGSVHISSVTILKPGKDRTR